MTQIIRWDWELNLSNFWVTLEMLSNILQRCRDTQSETSDLDWWRRQHDLRVGDHGEHATQRSLSAENGDETSQIVDNQVGQCAVDLRLPVRVVAMQPLVWATTRVPQDAFNLSRQQPDTANLHRDHRCQTLSLTDRPPPHTGQPFTTIVYIFRVIPLPWGVQANQ